MVMGNLFANVPQQLANEAVEELLSAPNVRIERIVSIGHATAADEWCDQDRGRVGAPPCRFSWITFRRRHRATSARARQLCSHSRP